MLDFGVLSTSVNNPTVLSVIYAFLLSFTLGTLIAVLYIKSFQGLSYSRNFLHCLILCPILTAITIQAIGDNIARGIGMIGAISILRFRTNVKDPRDMFFIFAALAIGLSCGVHAYAIASIGALCFGLAVIVLAYTPFAHGPHFDGLLRLNIPNEKTSQQELENVLTQNCKNFALLSIREMSQGDVLDYSYQVKFKNEKNNHSLMKDIKNVPGSKSVNLMMQESIVEV